MRNMTFAKSVRMFSREPISKNSWTDIYLKYREQDFDDAYCTWMADNWENRVPMKYCFKGKDIETMTEKELLKSLKYMIKLDHEK